MLIDSHCHLNFLDSPDVCLAQAREHGVGGFLCIGVDAVGTPAVLALADAHPDVWASVGLHPEGAADDPAWIDGFLDHPRVVAAGEMGLDYFHQHDPEARRTQLDRFEFQLALASAHGLPAVIHTRAAEADTLERLRAFPDVRGVLHCFTESWEMAAAAMDLGYFVSISGIVTFRNADNVREVARRIPGDRLLVETDSPWLAPVPFRGKPNQPAFVTSTAAFLAELRGETVDQFADQTTRNFFTLFDRAG